MPNTSERTPVLYGMLRAKYEVVGLPAPREHLLFDSDRSRWPRLLLYLVDRAILTIKGLSMARRHSLNLVFCEGLHHALPGMTIAKLRGIRCVWDSHGNVELLSQSLGDDGMFAQLSVRLESFLGHHIDALVTVSKRDAETYARAGIPRTKIHVIPTCVRIPEIATHRTQSRGRGNDDKRKHTLLFFGSFKYAPNREALRFINDVLAPYLDRNGIRCEIQIAGREIPELSYHSSISILGFVPDIHEQIQSADLCIVPVWRGVGILTKVLDILAVGTPVVLSAFALHGIPEIRHKEHAYVASSENEFSDLVLEAITNPELCEIMAGHARRLVTDRYSWEVHWPRLDRVLWGEVAEG